MIPGTCSIEGCQDPVRGRGWCNKHLLKAQRYGDPLAGRPRYATTEESFAARTKREGDCLVWTGSLNSAGYGHITHRGRVVRAHRYAWERANGPIPRDAELDHICHNRACVNVEHLRPATRAQNGAHLSGPHVDSESGVRGVHRNRKGWCARATKDGRTYSGGTFPTIAEAERAVVALRAELFGEYAGH